MTVLSALSAASGTLFPARLSRVELLRSLADGERREVLVIDIAAVRSGGAADVPLRGGDVVRVPANAILVPPWAVYALIRELIRFGANVAVI
jgi:hypothetical protein